MTAAGRGVVDNLRVVGAVINTLCTGRVYNSPVSCLRPVCRGAGLPRAACDVRAADLCRPLWPAGLAPQGLEKVYRRVLISGVITMFIHRCC